jgi:hypothetical protein
MTCTRSISSSGPLESGHYRVIEINVPLRNSHYADVVGPPLEAPK